jgi:hypothetical protein
MGSTMSKHLKSVGKKWWGTFPTCLLFRHVPNVPHISSERSKCTVLAIAVAGLLGVSPAPGGEDLPKEAARALRRACDYFRKEVATEGGYLWRYSEDLKRREGEGKATATTAWVQPPGTPTVGGAYLGAYQATGDKYYLDAARETGVALAKGQLLSGGWDYRIEFDPEKRKQYAFREAPGSDKAPKNVTTLDDNTTQEAVRFLMRLDRQLEFRDPLIHPAVSHALACLLNAQYPNGAWPQRFDRFPDPARHPVKKASYPDSWSRTWPAKDYKNYYTLNDNTLADIVDVMLEAAEFYQEPKYRKAALKAGDFLLLAQMPEPQPVWAQQYDLDMHPAWARKFEPPAVTGGESFGAMQVLLRLYRESGDKKYLEPVPRALDYFRKVRLPDGRLARFYELKTSKPLYFTKDYKLTYSDADMPTHYGFKVGDRTDRIAREYDYLVKLDPAKLKRPPGQPTLSAALKDQVKSVIAALDERGRWVEDGKLKYHGADDPTRRIISCQTFVKNVSVLSSYLKFHRK